MTSLAATDDGSGGPEGTEGDNEAEAEAKVEVEVEAAAGVEVEVKVEVKVEDGEDEEDGDDDDGDRRNVVNVQHPTRKLRSISSSPVNARASPMIVPACETRRIRSCPTPTPTPDPNPTSHSLLYCSHPMCDAESNNNEGEPSLGTGTVLHWWGERMRTRVQSGGADLPHVL